MMKKISAISIILLLLGCSISVVSAGHYSVIYTGPCEGNLKMYTWGGDQTMNWDFSKNNEQRIYTDGWRRVHINPLGWFNPETDASWEYVPDELRMYKKGDGGIGI
ncbi:MAG: protein A9507_10960 [Methanobrevibacter sp. CfCl-M3]